MVRNIMIKKNNGVSKINIKLLALSLVTLLQATTSNLAGLCGSRPVAPEGRRYSTASTARRVDPTPAPMTSEELNQVMAGLEAYGREQSNRERMHAFMLGMQEGAAAARATAITPAPAPADISLVLGRRSSDEAKEA